MRIAHTSNLCVPPSPLDPKTGGRFEIEAALCPEYYRIRDLLYGEFDFF